MSFADGEVIWETEIIGGLNEVQVSPLGEVLYNTNDSIIEVRSIDDGRIVDAITFPNTTRLDHISISADGRFMAVSGQTKYTIIYDLFEKKEVKRITTVVYVRKEYGKDVVYNTNKWVSSSISPDGTKITGVVLGSTGEMTNFVVIDIATEKVLFEQRRISYDHFNPSDNFYKWHTAEFSPDGNYIVSQLEYRAENNVNSLDTVYIYNTKNFEIDNVLLNAITSNSHFSFDATRNLLSTSKGKTLMIYNYESKHLIEKYLTGGLPYFVVFSKYHNKITLGVGASKPFIYNYVDDRFDYEYPYFAGPRYVTNDNKYLVCSSKSSNRISLIVAEWDKATSVNSVDNEVIISPNPTTGSINISFSNRHSSIFQYEIISTSGQIVQSGELGYLNIHANTINMEISTIANGQYLLRVFSEQEEFVFNVIKED